MSEASENIIIQTGGDPRHWPEFSAIREEINKINHPARPEVNWRLIESLALTLFRTNGVDLQTTVYYALARTQRHGLAGFTESCELLAGMVVSQWERLWPEQPQARSEILEWFNARVGSQLRQHEFGIDDLRLVYRAERALQLLCDKLQQVELKRVPRIENLLYLMQNTAKRLEAAHEAAKQPPAQPLKMPSMVYLSVPEAEPIRTLFSGAKPAANEPPPAYEEPVPPPKEQPLPNVEVRFAPPPPAIPKAAKRAATAWGFGGGVLCSLVVAGAAYLMQVKPMQERLAGLSATPEGSVQLWLAQPTLDGYGQQLNTLENLSPLAGLRTADASVALANQLWPTDPEQIAQSQRWQRLLQARLGSERADNSYFQVQQRLQALSDKLLEQEQTRGSLTLSYLKTQVYQMQSELNRETPLEELLRQLAVSVEQQQPASPVLLKQIDERWNALLSRYHQLTQQAAPAR
ncbi:VasL domain-containing protein [Serratia fonticola]|uniref:VasL domain-containing protein n=1 Tax=Serratia fonticola TaxID=47917 RepID=UPI0027F17A77|nr:VasL domain-containing protein [Serratia fonticola]MDQ7212226.1 VasL domain-containing protein [Serratia fonticola]HBE9082309.1 type VI secretion system ImpA family N-terminal domain-containing protein [Serratia fonticola]HBE9092920.1 type VI secretion system ImpA family N-terminal domain-containing protein [Serratia fonticola]HBE9155144.1 type VI secretion system ImpA family N-terminal domain-containing protein [Serratia fonticola]